MRQLFEIEKIFLLIMLLEVCFFLTAVGRCVPVVVSAETGQEESWNFLDSSHLKLGTGEDNKATTVLLASIAQGLSLHTDPIQSAAPIVSSSWIRQSWSSKVR